jgi:26S proteasome regulatory subunit T3
MEEIGIDIQVEVSLLHCNNFGAAADVSQTSAAPSSEKQVMLNSLPTSDEELFTAWKRLEAHKEFIALQEVRCVPFDFNLSRHECLFDGCLVG